MREADLLVILDQGPIGPEALALMSKAQRRRAQAGIDALIDYLDAVTPDADLEPTFGFLGYGQPHSDECEPDEEGDPLDDGEEEHDGREPDVDDEYGRDDEPSFGSSDLLIDQRRWTDGHSWSAANENEQDDSDLENDGRYVRPQGSGAEPSELSEAEILSLPALYTVTVDGDCLEPLVHSGAKLVMSPFKAIRGGDLVLLWRRCPDGTRRAYVKRLVSAPDPGLASSDFEACWLFEMLHPRKMLPLGASEIIAVHKVVGTKAPDGRLYEALMSRNAAFLRVSDAAARCMPRVA